jgi:hypothetical protein
MPALGVDCECEIDRGQSDENADDADLGATGGGDACTENRIENKGNDANDDENANRGPELATVYATIKKLVSRSFQSMSPLHVEPARPIVAPAEGALALRKDQSRSNSLIEVLERVLASTRLTMTAQ